MSSDFRETLYTIDKGGKRKWVYSHLIKGRYFKLRAVVIYSLMALYLSMPWIVIGGEQALFFDIPDRRFVFFGNIFFASDTFFLFLILIGLAIALFFFTSLLGRVWCGWACPETVFLEFLFRPIEKLIEGGPAARLKLDQSAWNGKKIRIKATKYFIYLILAWILASTFLAYFVGRHQLLAMMQGSPLANPTLFTLTLLQVAVVIFQFGWFREQFCTVLCPYARFQSVLMDGDSLGVGYDANRGEPRGKLRAGNSGDCVDCGLCVRVCPTGIDIRNGLQLECIHCAQCVDACNSVMGKIGKPQGLIRYDTENRLAGKVSRMLRARVFIYATILLVIIAVFSYRILNRSYIDAQILRGAIDAPFSITAAGQVVNHLTLRVHNKDSSMHQVAIAVNDDSAIEALIPASPYPLAAEQIGTIPLFITFPANRLVSGKHLITLQLQDERGRVIPLTVTLLGPG